MPQRIRRRGVRGEFVGPAGSEMTDTSRETGIGKRPRPTPPQYLHDPEPLGLDAARRFLDAGIVALGQDDPPIRPPPPPPPPPGEDAAPGGPFANFRRRARGPPGGGGAGRRPPNRPPPPPSARPQR